MMERYLTLFFFFEEDLKFVFPGRERRRQGKGKGRGLTEEGDFILAVSRDVRELFENGASSVSRGSSGSTQPRREREGIRGRKKTAIVVRISYIDCSYIFSTDFWSASARRRSNSVEVNFVNIKYSVQVGQCTT